MKAIGKVNNDPSSQTLRKSIKIKMIASSITQIYENAHIFKVAD